MAQAPAKSMEAYKYYLEGKEQSEKFRFDEALKSGWPLNEADRGLLHRLS